MVRDDVIYLVNENPQDHGAFNRPEETLTRCFCRVQSVTRQEYYRALENNIEPVYVFILSEYADYDGQKIVIYNEKRYRVIRTYVTENEIELTVGVATADV